MSHRAAFAVSTCLLLSTTASFAQPASGASANLHVLSEDDAERYRTIIDNEREGRFADAQSQFANVSDTSLKGYVLAEHYLSPYGHASREELLDWLHEYAELPIADRVYDLAVKRSTRRVRHHHHTILVAEVTDIPVPGPAARRRGGGYEDVDLPDPGYESEAARAAAWQIEQSIRSDQPDQAKAVLDGLSARGATQADIARLSHHVAASYLAEGMDLQAFEVATSVDPSSKSAQPLLYWDAGLSAYRLGKYHDAAQQFGALAQEGAVPNWTRSAAAFWSARSYLQDGDPQQYVTLLELAAKSEPTFYGLIAERILGQDTETGFSDPVVSAEDFAEVMQDPAAHRAVALWQIGDNKDAAIELNRAYGESDSRLDPVYVALADRMSATNLELRASETSASRGIILNGLFPVPDYRPEGGYRIDPSLILAFARIESRFQPQVTSPAGARGLMQIMPGTAAHLDGPGAAEHLYDESYNLSLGQRYLEELLDQVNGNLIELAAAYNAGPGALTRWLGTKGGAMDDPLLFIESMPVPETRMYVKRMMTYHWMYRRRMGRDAATLDETAQGGWPIYRPAEPTEVSVPTPVMQQTVPQSNTTIINAAGPSS